MSSSLALSLSVIFVGVLVSGCKLEPVSTVVDPPPLADDTTAHVDTNWVKRPQMDIPWPSLANSPWPMFLHDPQHTGRSPYRGPQEGRVEWSYQTGAEIYASPVIGSDGTVYIESWDHFLYAITPEGGLKWQFDFGEAGECTVTLGSNGTVYAGSTKAKYFYALDEDGHVKWTYPVGPTVNSAPVLSRDGKTLYFVAENNSTDLGGRWVLYALSSEGFLRWRFAAPSGDLFPNAVALSPDGTTIYCPGQGRGQASFYAVDTSGALRWRYITEGSGTQSYTSSPCVDNDGNIYFSGQCLYSLTPAGTVRWQTGYINGNPDGGPCIGKDGSLVIASGRYVMSFDYAGRQKWKINVQSSQCTPAIDNEGTIYVGSNNFRSASDTLNFYAFYPNGGTKFRLSLRAADGAAVDVVSSPCIASDGSIYVGSDRPHGFRLFKIR